MCLCHCVPTIVWEAMCYHCVSSIAWEAILVAVKAGVFPVVLFWALSVSCVTSVTHVILTSQRTAAGHMLH